MAAAFGAILLILLSLACTQDEPPTSPTVEHGRQVIDSVAREPLSTTTLAPTKTPSPTPTATSTPTPIPTPSVELIIDVATSYYDVHGRNPAEIFDYMSLYGPQTSAGERGMGLASRRMGLTWQTRPAGEGCRLASASLRIDLEMVLPRLLTVVEAGVAARWEQVAADIAEHEQTHVDIYVRGAESLKASLESVEVLATCGDVDQEVQRLHDQNIALTNEHQKAFHVEDDARRTTARVPLEQELGWYQSELASVEAEIGRLDASVNTTDSAISTTKAQLTSLRAELEAIEAQYPSGFLPPEVYSKYKSLKQQHNGLLPTYQAQIDQYNSTIDSKNHLVQRYNALVAEANRLVEELN